MVTIGDVLAAKQRREEERAFAAEMLEALMDGEVDIDADGECADGCVVEPDGCCPHGYTSWMLVAGII